MNKKLKEIIWLIILLTLLTISAFSQNQFSDYVKHIETQEAPKLDKFINEWIGVPYKLGGKTKKGIDCSQFTKRLYRDVYGLELKDVAYKQWSQTNRIPKTNLIIGDIHPILRIPKRFFFGLLLCILHNFWQRNTPPR